MEMAYALDEKEAFKEKQQHEVARSEMREVVGQMYRQVQELLDETSPGWRGTLASRMKKVFARLALAISN